MLLHSKAGRAGAWLIFLLLFVPIFGFPVITVILMGFAKSWNSTLPSGLTFSHVADALTGAGRTTILTSLETAVLATAISMIIGTWAALAAQQAGRTVRRVIDGAFLIPIAVPSVVIGLSLLLGFSRSPFLLNGMPILVVIAHVVLVTAFTYTTAAAALSRLDPACMQVAASLGARPAYVLRKVTLPLLMPGLIAGAGLSFALSMGELGATVLVYPTNYVTQPVAIFQLTDKSADVINGGAYTVVLLAATVIALTVMSRIRTKASYR